MYVFIAIIHVDLLLSFALFTWVKKYNFILFLYNKTENVMYIKIYMSFYPENSLLLLYVPRMRVNQSNMKV